MRFSSQPVSATLRVAGLLTLGLFAWVSTVRAASVEDCARRFLKGNYQECIKEARHAIEQSTWDEQWSVLLAKSQLATGDYPGAQKTVEAALDRYENSVQLRLTAYDVFNANGNTTRAADALGELGNMLEQISARRGGRLRLNRDAPNLVALGKALILLNVDPKPVLENFFDEAKKSDPDYRESYLAAGELALDKDDWALAAKTFEEALKKFPNDPDAEFGLARAYAPSEPQKMGELLGAVLEYNTNHVRAMVLMADHFVDAEEYTNADKLLSGALRVNPWDPEAWAYRAVLAELRNDTNGAVAARQSALKFWTNNPRVDFTIGRKLSQRYRFAEGAGHQRLALQFSAAFEPARIQLAQDLLRLGDEANGWQMAEEVHEKDGYDVAAFNLVTLRKEIAKFQTVTNGDFIVRMDPHEAAVFGDEVLALLVRAKDRLSVKYGMHLDRPTVVELFTDEKDFGVRTFGTPHNPGFLGVCFGHVITANSPSAEPGHPHNWEAVLWHEFCHVITLGITKNKMPRWLSEGISVYEESQADPTWGEAMNPGFREMILGGDLKPVGDLSSAFMTARDGRHVQFAYFESSLVVEYFVQNFGLEAVKQILVDLGNGVEINDAIARHTAPMDKIETDFAAFARQRANNLAPGLDWKKSDAEERAGGKTVDIINVASAISARTAPKVAQNSTNYWDLMTEAKVALEAKKWSEAKVPLQKLIDRYPSQTGGDSAYALLAMAYRGLNETVKERETLAKLAPTEADDTETWSRLMELDEVAGDWSRVMEMANRYLAVNPLVAEPYRNLARAAEKLNQPGPAIRAYQRMLLLDPADPADVHFHLAAALDQRGDAGAKQQVLEALEDAPRFRDAQKLLLKIEGENPPGTSGKK